MVSKNTHPKQEVGWLKIVKQGKFSHLLQFVDDFWGCLEDHLTNELYKGER